VPERLARERLGSGAPGARALFDAAFAAIPAAAFVTDADGALREANPAGLLWLEREGRAGHQAICESVQRSGDPRFVVTPVFAPGAPARKLLVMRDRGEPALEARAAAAAARWSLTPRQRDVLALLLEGVTTRAIAASLGVSERAVELHITAMFEKAQVENRAELCAAVWRVAF
jgi:DNA-binding CsgD family transcriptional regulator